MIDRSASEYLPPWLALCGLLSSPFGLAEELLEPVTVATTPWPPYVESSGDGIATTVIDRVLRGMKREPRVTLLPDFKTVLDSRQELFGVYPYIKCTPGYLARTCKAEPGDPCCIRDVHFEFSRPIMDFEYVIVVRSSRIDEFSEVKILRDLREKSTRRVSGYSYGPLDDFIQDAGEALPNQTKALALLAQGKIDYVAISRLHYLWLMDQKFLDTRQQFAQLDAPDQHQLSWTMDLHFLVPKTRNDAEQLLKEFNDSLARVTASGLVEQLKREASDDFLQRAYITLTDPAAIPLVTVYLKRGGVLLEGECKALEEKALNAKTDLVSVPRGTRAVVLNWNENFLPPKNPNERSSPSLHEQLQALSRVRILNGPLKNYVVCVKSMFIELDTPE
jgi:hypothetical protein